MKVGVAGAVLDGNASAEGSSSSLARADHTHLLQGIERRTSDPVSAHFVGRMYFNTASLRLRVCIDAATPVYVQAPFSTGGGAGSVFYRDNVTNAPANGQILRAVGAVPTWVAPVAYYEPRTTPASITVTTEGTAQTVIAGAARTYENVPYLFEFVSPRVGHSVDGVGCRIVLFEDGTALGNLTSFTGTAGKPCYGALRHTPSAGSHTYSVRAWTGSGTGTINAGAGGTGDVFVPAYLRVVRDG